MRAVQLTNRSGYLGYQIVTTLGWTNVLSLVVPERWLAARERSAEA